MLAYVIPAAFLVGGLAVHARRHWRRRAAGRAGDALLRVLGSFAVSAGVFLLALTVMCRG